MRHERIESERQAMKVRPVIEPTTVCAIVNRAYERSYTSVHAKKLEKIRKALGVETIFVGQKKSVIGREVTKQPGKIRLRPHILREVSITTSIPVLRTKLLNQRLSPVRMAEHPDVVTGDTKTGRDCFNRRLRPSIRRNEDFQSCCHRWFALKVLHASIPRF